MDLQTFSEIGSMILIATKLILDCVLFEILQNQVSSVDHSVTWLCKNVNYLG